MTGTDVEFVRSLLLEDRFKSPVLELGAGYGGETCRDMVVTSGRRYFATDLKAAPGIDFVANFETGLGVEDVAVAGPFGATLVLNVLEHTFDPIAVLDNVVRVVAPGGRVVVIAPAVWPLHDYPIDCCRLLPDWYRRFGISRGLTLLEDSFRFLGHGPIVAFRAPNGQDRFPPPGGRNPLSRLYSRIVHKLFHTYGQGMMQPSHIVIGAIFVLPGKSEQDVEYPGS